MRYTLKYDKTWQKKTEINSGLKKVETSGYVPTKTLVQQMLLGGLQRGIAKNLMYDLARGKNIDDNDYDPAKVATRSYGFDYFDAVALRDALKERLKYRLKKQKQHDKNGGNNENSPEEPPPPSPPPPEE